MEETYFTKLKNTFKACKFNKKYLQTASVDFIYNILIFILLVFVLIFIMSSSININLGNLGSSIEGIYPYILSILKVFIPIFLAFVIIRFLLTVAAKGWIWRRIFDKKLSLSFFLKYAGFRLILFLITSLIFVIAFILREKVFVFILLILGMIFLIHLFFVSFIFLIRENKIFNSLKKGFKQGTIKFHLFLIPYLFIIAVFIIAFLIEQLLAGFLIFTPSLSLQSIFQQTFSLILSFLPYMLVVTIISVLVNAYLRIFYSEFVKRITNKNSP
jgi:hypothetical protein